MQIIFSEEEFAGGYNSAVEDVVKAVLENRNQPSNIEVEILFVSEDEIRSINNENRGVDKVTDVLSFPMLDIKAGEVITEENFPGETNPETGNFMLGSIIICQKRAEEQSIEYGHSVLREIAYLVTHGMLHLLGYDHMKESDKKLMREKEEEVLNKLSITRDGNV